MKQHAKRRDNSMSMQDDGVNDAEVEVLLEARDWFGRIDKKGTLEFCRWLIGDPVHVQALLFAAVMEIEMVEAYERGGLDADIDEDAIAVRALRFVEDRPDLFGTAPSASNDG